MTTTTYASPRAQPGGVPGAAPHGRFGRLVFTEGALPAVLPVNFVLDSAGIVIRTAPGGTVATGGGRVDRRAAGRRRRPGAPLRVERHGRGSRPDGPRPGGAGPARAAAAGAAGRRRPQHRGRRRGRASSPAGASAAPSRVPHAADRARATAGGRVRGRRSPRRPTSSLRTGGRAAHRSPTAVAPTTASAPTAIPAYAAPRSGSRCVHVLLLSRGSDDEADARAAGVADGGAAPSGPVRDSVHPAEVEVARGPLVHRAPGRRAARTSVAEVRLHLQHLPVPVQPRAPRRRPRGTPPGRRAR